MTLVFNASPLIVLAKAGLLDLAIGLADRIVIPYPVSREIIRCKNPEDAASLWLQCPQAAPFLVNPPATSDFVTAWGLGAGESSVITLAESMPGSLAVLDDLAARRCASALGIKVVGTLGLLVLGKKSGRIDSILGPLDAILAAGLFVSPGNLAEVKKLAGE